MTLFDLIVVGAGPAGSACARKAAQLGLSVALVDRARFPRRKVCAGAVTPRTREILDFDFSSVVQASGSGVHFYSPSGVAVEHGRFSTPCFLVKRLDFDHLLVRKAEEAGARLFEVTKVVDVQETDRVVRVLLEDGGHIAARLVVGADGVHSTVAAKTGIRPRWKSWQFGGSIEAEVPMDPKTIARLFGDPDRPGYVIQEAYLGPVRGYGWIFPKRAELSIGFCAVRNRMKNIHDGWSNFITRIEKAKDVTFDLSTAAGWNVPLAGLARRLTSKRVMLVGDAGGFVSPASGEGIYYGIVSGQIAAGTAHGVLTGRTDISAYERACRSIIGRDFARAYSMAGLMSRSPSALENYCRMAAADPFINGCFQDTLGGARSYGEIRARFAARALTRHPLRLLGMLFGK